MKNIYLIRHGETVSNAGGVAIRNAEIPLTEKGKLQSQAVADWLLDNVAPIDAVHVSKFIRTHQTAAPLIERTGLEATVIAGLEEFNYLSFERIAGLPASERRQLATEYWENASPDCVDGATTGDAESFSHLQRRQTQVITTFQTLPEGNHVVYTHGLWLAMLLWRSLNFPTRNNADMQRFRQFEQALKIANGEIFLCQFHNDGALSLRKIREV